MKKTKPLIMVAPNGARKSKADHPNLPITIDEIIKTASSCFNAGANSIHAHVRDELGRHILDAGLYKELITELEQKVPAMKVQITTEAVGQYSPFEQRELVREVKPKAVSVALGEMTSDGDITAQRQFYFEVKEQNIDLQHIIYSPDEVLELANLIKKKIVPANDISLLFVLGRYTKDQVSNPKDILPFLKMLEESGLQERSKFMVCAFGKNELACLFEAVKQGADCRIGFENNHFLSDGNLAIDNAKQVSALVEILS